MTEFSNLGKHCSKQGCGQKDFLPFECKECRRIYCLAHRSATDHQCQVDITQKNVMPLCPICNQYIRVKAGQVPDAIMNDHIVNACKTNLLQSHLEKVERHAKRRCGICSNPEKYETIVCKLCEGQFCLTHRAPESHKCDKGKKPKPKKDVSNSRALALMAKIQANKNAKAEEKAAAERELARLVLESESEKSSRPSVVDEKHASSSARRASVEKPTVTRQPSQDKPSSSTPNLSRQGSSEKSKPAAFPAASGGMVPLTMSSFDANAVPAEEKKIVMSSSSSSSATPRPDAVIVSQGGSSKSSSSSSKTPSSPTPPSNPPNTFTDEHIQQLVDIGITPSQAYQALSMFGGNVELAGSYLFTEMQALRDIEARKNKNSSDVKSSGTQAAPSLPATPAPVRAPSEQNRRPSDPSLGGALLPSPEMEEAIKRSQIPDAPAGPVPFYKSNVMKGIIASRTDQERELIQKMTTRMLAVGDKKIPESDRFYLEVNYPVEYMNGSMSVAKGKKQLSKYGQSMFFDQNWTVQRCIEEIANHAGLEYDPSPNAEKKLDMVGKRTNIHFPHDIPVGLLDPDLRTCDSIILEYT